MKYDDEYTIQGKKIISNYGCNSFDKEITHSLMAMCGFYVVTMFVVVILMIIGLIS